MSADRTTEAETIVSAISPAEATRRRQSLRAAQMVHAVVLEQAERISRTGATFDDRDDLDLTNEVHRLDGTLLRQDLIVEALQVIECLFHGEPLEVLLAELMSAEQGKQAVDAVCGGPLAQVALSGCSGVRNHTPERPEHGRRVTGPDGKSYPGSQATVEAQRARIVALRADHPDWSARRIARDVGCSQNTVNAVDEVLAGATS